MTKTIVGFDLETTGLDTQNDHILQLGLIRFDSKTFEELDSLSWYIKPKYDFTITPEAQEKTGFTKEFILENGVFLSDIWEQVVEFIGTDDMLSYNGNYFDVPMLHYNLLRYGLSFDFTNRKFYDSYTIERKRNSMKLADVYKRYTGLDLENAHDTLADVRALVQIFKHQNEIEDGIEDPEFKLVSPEGFVKMNADGKLVFAIGKYKGKLTNDVCKIDKNYINWIFEKFSEVTKRSIMEAWYAEHPRKL